MGSSSEEHRNEKAQEAQIEELEDRRGEIPLEIKPTTSIDVNKGDQMDYDRVDKEVAEYAGGERVVIDEETDKRLKNMIDRRVLVIMILTYFLQALDKGTISFVSIMNMPEDLNLKDQEVSSRRESQTATISAEEMWMLTEHSSAG